MAERPKIKLEREKSDTMLEIAGWGLLLAVWTLVAAVYSGLPDIIPIHYNAAGEADGFGGKGNILTLCSVMTVLYVGMTVLNRFPHIFNYLVEITQENAFEQYRNATRMMRFLKLAIAVVFGLLVFKTVHIAEGQSANLGSWFLPLALGLVFIPLLYFLIKSRKVK